MNPQQKPEHISTRYTIIPITDPQHQKKLQYYMQQPQHPKTSFCRFYLRGICIMKPHLCKFAHKFEDITIQQQKNQQYLMDLSLSSKQKKKKYFEQRQDFQQKALFLVKNIQYHGLYDYQFSQKWKQSKLNKNLWTLEELQKDQTLRNKIRLVMHRQNWHKLVEYLLHRFPKVDFTMAFLAHWFGKLGFEKPQTRCKFNDFTHYMTHMMQFKEIYVVVPPKIEKTVYFINYNKDYPQTYMAQRIDKIIEIHQKAKEEEKQSAKLQPLPQNLFKTYICRYYMSGNCQNTDQECRYAHSIQQLKYKIGQKFQPQYKQNIKGRQQEIQRANFLSLYRYSIRNLDPKVTQQQINDQPQIRSQLRRKMHLSLYQDFMELLFKLTEQDKLQLKFIAQQYYAAGFNHSSQDKFGQLQSALPDIGYILEEVKNTQGPGKITYVYKVPELQKLDIYYQKLINEILIEEVTIIEEARKKEVKKLKINEIQQVTHQKMNENQDSKLSQQTLNTNQQPRQLILQSSFRKKIYRYQDSFNVPLHLYLKFKNQSLQQAIKSLIREQNQHLLDHIFFQTNQQNYRKLVQICKIYLRERKDYVHKLQNLQLHIKSKHKDQINLNGFVNFKGLLQSAVIDAGKKVYFLGFGGNLLVVDKGNMCLHEKVVVKGKYLLKNYQTKQNEVIQKIKGHQLFNERIVLVDNIQSQIYAQDFLLNCNRFGVDLQGRLRKQGYIDLIQISAIFEGKKQIFIFDVFVAKRMQDLSLYERMQKLLKNLFEDQNRVKILHDCKQDSTALKFLMDISLKNVFDTAGMNIILEQKEVYTNWNKKQQTTHHLLKKVYQVKIPSLNTVLQKWGAPNGVNIFKQSMKKRFHQQGTRPYFQQRPIDPQFLQYSAQDVQDLIQVYQNMKKSDTQKLSQIIGQIYSTFCQ